MDERDQKILRQTFELAKENNRMLRKIRRDAFIGSIFKLLWIAILIGLPIYLYFNFLEPVVEQLGDTYQGAQSGVVNVQESLKDLPLVGDYFAPEGSAAE